MGLVDPGLDPAPENSMKPIRQKRNEVVELVRRRGKTVEQDDGRIRRVPGLAPKDTTTPAACTAR
jgi:hypothetical protein